MKRNLLTILMVLSIATPAWSDGVVMATQEDLAAFDSMIKEDRTRKEAQIRKDTLPNGNFNLLVRDEAAKLKNEGSQGRGSQPGKWVVEQKKSGQPAVTTATDTRASQRSREDGRSKNRRQHHNN
ncbi:MAG: hypothetical protein ABL958_10935 [Bdellovibrionia bacterium]